MVAQTKHSRDCLFADEKSPVNQRFLPIWGKNGCVFLFPQNGYEEIDLPRGIGSLK